MKNDLIQIIFSDLVETYGHISSRLISNFEELNQPEILNSIFDTMTNNPHEQFEYKALHTYEFSHNERTHEINITCNFLHIAIQRDRADLVKELLEDHKLNPLAHLKLSYIHELNDVRDAPKKTSISPMALAQRNGHTEIIDILKDNGVSDLTTEEILTWVENDVISDIQQSEIIEFIKQNYYLDLDTLAYEEEPMVMWVARLGLDEIMQALCRYISTFNPNKIYIANVQAFTALSIATYFGNSGVVDVLLRNHASITPNHHNAQCIDPYQALGDGHLNWPTYFEYYQTIFHLMNVYDERQSRLRKYFSDKYVETKNRAYLVCTKLFDRHRNTIQVSYQIVGNNKYNIASTMRRDILAVEDQAIRHFFRFNNNIRIGGIADQVSPILFNTHEPFVLDGYPARSIIVAIVHEMRCAPTDEVQAAIDKPGSVYSNPEKCMFSLSFTLGDTELKYDWAPQRWQRGNSILKIKNRFSDRGEYKNPKPFGHDLAHTLAILTDTENEESDKINERTRTLGTLLLNKTKTLQPFRFHEFSYDDNTLRIRISGDRTLAQHTSPEVQEIIDDLNGLLILWSIVEPTRRLSGHQDPNARTEKPNAIHIDHIPVATMQIRALQLLKEGVSGVNDVFGVSEYEDGNDHNQLRALFGVSTHKDMIKNFEQAKTTSEWLANMSCPSEHIVNQHSWFSRNYTKQLLKEGYGSGNESSDDDYSDEEFDPYLYDDGDNDDDSESEESKSEHPQRPK